MSTIILLVFIAVVMGRVWWMEEKHDETDRRLSRMAKNDLKAARKRGDIDKEGRCLYYGPRCIR